MRIGFLAWGGSVPAMPPSSPAMRRWISLVVADADQGRARAVADAIVVATATDSHAELIAAGARAGIPVFCEKPVALDVPGTRGTGPDPGREARRGPLSVAGSRECLSQSED